jgi:hypothetical protein
VACDSGGHVGGLALSAAAGGIWSRSAETKHFSTGSLMVSSAADFIVLLVSGIT